MNSSLIVGISLPPTDVKEYWNSEANKEIASVPKAAPFLVTLLDQHIITTSKTIIQNVIQKRKTPNESYVVLKTDLWDEGITNLMGNLLDFFPSEQVTRIGIDISPFVCNNAKRKTNGKVCVICADVRNLPFRSHSINMILDLSAIDHIPPPQHPKVLQNFHYVLKRNGTLFLVAKIRNFLVGFRMCVTRKRFGSQPYSWFLNSNQIQSLLKNRRFRIIGEYSMFNIVTFARVFAGLANIDIIRKILSAAIFTSQKIECSRLSKYFKHIARFYVLVWEK